MMQFTSVLENGPCWMSPAQRLASKKDRPSIKTITTDRPLKDLRAELQAKGVSTTGNKKRLQQLCTELDVPSKITTEEIKIKTSDWVVIDLRKDLAAKGIHSGGNKKELQKRCSEAGVPVQIATEKVTEGWEGKPKGMLQILFERGCIDPNRMNEYTVDGKNDEFGNWIRETSLRHLMDQLSDFQDEETLLQYHGRKLGVKVDRTPKVPS
jgi:hypothetical protein